MISLLIYLTYFMSSTSSPSQLKTTGAEKNEVLFFSFSVLKLFQQPGYQIVSWYLLKYVMQAYLLLVPGTTTASLCLFFLCRKEANVFLTLGSELEFSLVAEFPEESLVRIAETFCGWAFSSFPLNFFAFENAYWFNRSPSESSSKSKDNLRITVEACSRIK